MVKVGIAGYGFMGRFHHAAYAKVDAGKVVAVFDVNLDACQAAQTAGNIGTAQADLSGVALFDDYDAFLGKVDVVDICTPTPFHVELSSRAFKAGRHVLLEKPMALTLEECDAMIAGARAAGVTFMVAHCVRFWPGYDTLIAAARDGRWGRLLAAHFTRLSGSAFWSPWFLAEARSGGAVLDLLVHDFDMCRALGGLPDTVDAVGSIDGLGTDTGVNYASAVIRSPGAQAPQLSVTGGWLPSPKFPFSMGYLAEFQKATLSFQSGRTAPLVIYEGDAEPRDAALPEGDGYEAEIRYFLSVLGGVAERCLPEDARDAVAIGLAARASVRTGRPAIPARPRDTSS